MVKKTQKSGKKPVQVRVKKVVMKRPKNRKKAVKQPVFGPISTIDTAPVSIGNSVTGSTPIIIPIVDGQRIQGRDYLINVDATKSSIVDWTLVAASPIAPACMVASTLKHFSSTYAHYQVHGVAFHYITSSSTANNGSIMFYINKDRAGPALPTDSANFMPAVLSDHNTLIGPLWKNNTASYFPEPRWYPTDVFNNEDLAGQCPGEVLVYTKTNANEIPGYILVDYDISFRTLSVNPKSSMLPVSRMKYTQVAMIITATPVTSGLTTVTLSISAGTLLDGATTSIAPTGLLIGDVYKVYFDANDAVLTNVTSATLLRRVLPGGTNTLDTLTDGFTCYAAAIATSTVTLFPTLQNAITGALPYTWGVTATVTVSIPAYISLACSEGGSLLQASI